LSRPAGIFWSRLVTLVLVASLIAAWRLSFQAGPALWSALSGIAAGGASTALSFLVLERSLRASNLKFLKAFFLGILIRVAMLAVVGLLVWGNGGWSLKLYLLAVGLSYPFLLLLEGWQLSQQLSEGRKRAAAKASSSEG
jgi:hypothetical protein